MPFTANGRNQDRETYFKPGLFSISEKEGQHQKGDKEKENDR